jgi:hypothetical protein
MPAGELKAAEVPSPLASAARPVPAIVVTTQELAEALAEGGGRGGEGLAELLSPGLAEALGGAGGQEITLSLAVLESSTKTAPEALTARPVGVWKEAPARTKPSTLLPREVPARVLRAPVSRFSRRIRWFSASAM